MEVFYKSSAVKQLKNLPKTEAKKIVKKLGYLNQNPCMGKSLKGKLKGFHSLRSWPYRIIYKIEGKKVVIYSIAHRQGVYN